MLNITASSGEFYQGDCESLILPTGDGVYGVQAGHNPVLVALHMGIAKFTVNGETREVLVGDGIAEVTPTFVLLLVDSAERPEDIDATVPRPPASALKSACSISRVCTNTTRARSPLTAPCSVCRPRPSISGKLYLNQILSKKKASIWCFTHSDGGFLRIQKLMRVSSGSRSRSHPERDRSTLQFCHGAFHLQAYSMQQPQLWHVLLHEQLHFAFLP